MKVKFGVCEFCFPYWGEPAIKMAHEAGFEGMQISDGGGVDYAYPLNNKWIQDSYLNCAEKYGITLHALYLSTTSKQRYMCEDPKSQKGKIAREGIRKGIEAASQMGIKFVTFDYLRVYGVAAQTYMQEALSYAINVGEDLGVQVAAEPDLTVSEELQLINRLEGKLKICYDTYNPLMYGSGYPPEMIKALGKDRIAYFHMKESTRDKNGFITKETAPMVPLGEGDTFFKESVQAIKDIDFEGWIMSETFYTRPNLHAKGEGYIELASKDLQTMKKSFERI